MNAEALLAQYERIAEAPDAIARLRRFVLDLAVRGKLTAFHFEEEMVRPLGSLAEFVMGQAPPGTSCNDRGDGTLFVKVGEFGERFPVHAAWTTEPLKFAQRGDVLICVVGATIGKLNLALDCAIGRSVAAIRPGPDLDQVFLFYSLMPFTLRLRDDARGTAQGVITRSDLAGIRLWVPPLAEQHRIVAKVDELMALCDRLEAARTAREATRDRLAAASLARLNTPDPETFPSDARFALDALPALTTRPDQIKHLRQTILNLAVRGKLVPQDENDEPAAELLKRLHRQRAAIMARAKVRSKRPVSLPPNLDNAGLPPGWSVEALGNLVDPLATISYGVLVPGPDVDDGIPFIRAQDLALSDHPPRPQKTIAPEIEAPYARTRIRGGEILLCVVGSIGKLGIAPPSWAGANIARAVARIAPMPEIKTEYALLVLRSEVGQGYFADATRTLAQPTLNVSLIEALPVPVPPLAEQQRIVAKVNALMALCDALEKSLAAATSARTRLLDATLAEALAPALATARDIAA